MKALVTLLFVFVLIASCKHKPRPYLTEIRFANDSLREIPDTVFEHPEVKFLSFTPQEMTFYGKIAAISDDRGPMNRIKKVPGTIGKLKNLHSLDLMLQDIRELPPKILTLPNLAFLNLTYNWNYDWKNQLGLLKKMSALTKLYLMGVNIPAGDTAIIRDAFKGTKTKVHLNYSDWQTD